MSQPEQQQSPPGVEKELTRAADHGEQSYKGATGSAGAPPSSTAATAAPAGLSQLPSRARVPTC